ncbi:MAG: hypothetical protein KKD35_04385 [Elusimicrobia bacterium]|nr:hypothetical protein [Elusimicrobiota bacterium]
MKNFIVFISIFALTSIFYPTSSINAGALGDKICSSVTNFLNKESAKADTAAKDCKEKCDWTKKKQKLIAAARKKANDSCDKGIAPDISEISEGLDKAAIEKLNKLYDADAGKMFDGAEELAAKDFNIDSKQAPTLTSSGGNVMSLKAGTPDIGTLNKSEVASLEQTASSDGSTTCDSCNEAGQTFQQSCLQICCDEESDREGNREGDWCKQLCSQFKSDPRCKETKKTDNWFIKALKAIWEFFADLYHRIFTGKTEKCEEERFNPDEKFCANGEIYERCGGEAYNPETECCMAGKKSEKCTTVQFQILIGGYDDLILFKPATESPSVSFKAIIMCCPTNIKWSSPSNKIKFVSATNQTTVQIVPLSESQSEGDVTIAVTVDGKTATKKLTVRRPMFMSHPPLVVDSNMDTIGPEIVIRTDGSFLWTLTDKWGKPLANAPVSENVTIDPSSSDGFRWEDRNFSGYTNANGQIQDAYSIWVMAPWITSGELNAVINQKLTVAGWVGTSKVIIKCSPEFGATITGTSPVELK